MPVHQGAVNHLQYLSIHCYGWLLVGCFFPLLAGTGFLSKADVDCVDFHLIYLPSFMHVRAGPIQRNSNPWNEMIWIFPSKTTWRLRLRIVWSTLWSLLEYMMISFWNTWWSLLEYMMKKRKLTWAASWQNQQNDCAPSEDSDQPGHLPSLMRVLAVRMNKAWVLCYPLSAQQKLIRLGGCSGWSESSLGAHAILLVLSWGGSYLMILWHGVDM